MQTIIEAKAKYRMVFKHDSLDMNVRMPFAVVFPHNPASSNRGSR
jgi:hypothetical protein